MQLSDILQNEKFKGASPDQQEEILDLYEAAVKEQSFGPGRFNMRAYLQAQKDVSSAKESLQLTPDPRSGGQRLKDEFLGGLENTAMSGTAVLAATGLLDPETAAARIAEDDREAQARPVSRAMRNFQYSSKEGWVGPILNLFTNPEAAALITAQGLGTSIPGLVAGGAGALVSRKAGAGREMALAATMLGVGGASTVIEGGSRFLEDLRQEAGGNLQDTETVANILRDQAKVETLKQRAIQRGATVGAFDAASVALPANALFKTARGLKGLAQRGVGDAAIQGMLGGAGEIAGNVAIGEETDPADAWAEFVGEMVPGMIELGIGGARKLIPQTEQAVKEKAGTASFFPTTTSAPTIQTERQPGQFFGKKLTEGQVAKAASKAEPAPVAETTTQISPAPSMEEPVRTEAPAPTQEEKSPEELAAEEDKKESSFVFLNNRFGPASTVAEGLAQQLGVRRGGIKVATTPEEDEALGGEFETDPDQDRTMTQNIDQADFVISIGNDQTYKNDVGQAKFRNYALDKQKQNSTFGVIEGRSEGVIIPALEAHLRANPDHKQFAIILPQNTAIRSTGKKREALINDANNISRVVFQYLLNRSADPGQNQEMVDRVRKATGMDYARAANPEQLVNNAIPALRFTSRQESAQELLKSFDPAADPLASGRVLVFPTDRAASHAKNLGPTAQKLGAVKGKPGLVGNTYALPIFGDAPRKLKKETVDRQGSAESFDPRKASLELDKLYDVARQNPDKEFWLMFGAYPNNFSLSQERAIFAGAGKTIPDNIRMLSSTAANVFPEASRPPTSVSTITTKGKRKKSTRTAEIPNLDGPIGPELALDPNDPDLQLGVSDRIRNKGREILRSIVLGERAARSLLNTAKTVQADRRRKAVGTPKTGTDYSPTTLTKGQRVSAFPFTAFVRSKKYGTMLVRVNNILPIGQENGVDLQTAAQMTRKNSQVIDANNALEQQYLVDIDFYAEVPKGQRTLPDYFRRESPAVKKTKASGKVRELPTEEIMPEDRPVQTPVGAQNNPNYLDLRYQGQNLVTEAEKQKSYRPGDKVIVPNEQLGQYIREVLFEDNTPRFREGKQYESLAGKAKRPFRPLEAQEKQTLSDALLTIESYRPGARLTINESNLLREALNILKDYAEYQNIALEAIGDAVEENTWALNQTGNYIQMLGRMIARDPKLGSLAKLNLFVPNLGTVTIEPDGVPQFVEGQPAGETVPVKAVFTPGDTTGLTDNVTGEQISIKPDSLYLYDQSGKVLQVLPFAFRNRFLPNAKGTNVVPFTNVMYPTVSLQGFDTRDNQARAAANQEAISEPQLKLVLGWAGASGLLGDNVSTDWRGRFALDILDKINQNQPVIARDPDTVNFILSYPGIFTGVVRNGNSLMVTEVTTMFGKHSSETPIAGTPEEFSQLFYRLLVPFFSMQENEFNREIQLGSKKERFFGQQTEITQKPEDIVGGGVGLTGDTAPSRTAMGGEDPSTTAQIREGERQFEEGLADENLVDTETQKTQGEVDRGIEGRAYNQLLEPAEGARQVRSLRQHMLISPAMADIIRKADPTGRYVRMLVLPEISYMARGTGNESKVAEAGYALVSGVTDPRTGEYLGDKRPLPTRPTSEVNEEEARLEDARTAAAGQLELGQFVFIPKDQTVQDMVLTHQNILGLFKQSDAPVLITDDTLEFNQMLGALQNVVSYDLADDGTYLTGVYDYEAGKWIGQLPYGDRRYTASEIAAMERQEAVAVGQAINDWLFDRRKAGVDTLTLNDPNLTDEEIKNRVLLLQLTAQSYLEGFGGIREQLEQGVAAAMMAKTRQDKTSVFLEDVEARFEAAVNEADISPEEVPTYRRMIEDAVNVFNSGVVFKPEYANDPDKRFGAGVTRFYPNEAGRPREHFLARVKKSGIPEQEANNLVDRLSFTFAGQFNDSVFFRRVFMEAILRSLKPGGEKLRAAFDKIISEYGTMEELFGPDYLNTSRPTNTLYGLALNLARSGYGGTSGLASRAAQIFKDMKMNERSFVSFEAGAEAIEGQAAAESKVSLVFSPDNMLSDYDAQKGLLADEYEADESAYDVLPEKPGRRQTKYEAFVRQMSKFRETLPFIHRAVHDIVMRQGFNFPAGYKPSYLGKSNAQLDLLFPVVKERDASQIGDEGKGKGFLSGKLLSSIFRLLPGVPASSIEPAVLSQIAKERYEAILQELVRQDIQELSDFEKVKDTLRQYELEKATELAKQSETRKGLEKTGRKVSSKTDPQARLLSMVASTRRVGPLPEVIRDLLAKSPTTSIVEANQLVLNRMLQSNRKAGAEVPATLREKLFEELLDPVGTFDDTIEADSLISQEDNRTRLNRILFEAVLPEFEARTGQPASLENVLGIMRRINAPYKTEANKRRVRRREKDISDMRKLADEENFSDSGVSFDDALFNLTDEREVKAMEYLRAAIRRNGLKNVRFSANRRELYPVFTLPGSADSTDIINSTIFINPELLANKLSPRGVSFLEQDGRERFDRLTEELADQLLKHEVAHLAYFEQIRNDYRSRYPNGEVSFDTYYADRIRKVSDFLRDPENGLKIKLPGRQAMPVLEAITELYPEATTRDDVLTAEFFRVLLELDKSNGKLFTEGLELQRSLQTADRIPAMIRGLERDNLMRQDSQARERRRGFLEWLRTVLDSLLSLFKNLRNSSDPRARKIYEVYGKVSQLYDNYFAEYVSPPKPATMPETQAEGLMSMEDAFTRARPIGAQATEAASRRVNEALGIEDGQTYEKRTRAEVLGRLRGTGVVETIDDFIAELSPDQITAIVAEANLDPDKITEAELMGRTFRLNLTERVALASYAVSRFVETGQVHKAQKVTEILSRSGRGMGQTISIGYKLLKEFLLRSPAGVVAEYASRLAENKRELKARINPQLQNLSEEVKAIQASMVNVTLGQADVQALITQINTLYSQALGQANPQNLEKIIRQHYAEFSGEKLANVLAAILPEFENKPLLFELADMVQANMLTQLGKQLSLRGRTVRRNIVNRKGMTNPEIRAERVAQILTEMHAVVKPPLPKSGNTVEDAIAGDARKILELASLGALSDEQVLASIESLGKFPSFDTNVAEDLRRRMEDASRTPAGFQRDRKFIDALRVLNAATRADGVPTVTAYWYMSLLSGPATFWMNFFSTAIKALFDIGTYSIAAANARGNPALALKYMTLGYKTFLASLSTIAWAEAKGILLRGDINVRTQGKYVDEETINALEAMETDTLLKNVLSKGKYIFRIMSASDALFGRSAMEGFATIQANIQAVENIESGLSNLSEEEEAARLLNQTDDFVTVATQTALGEGLRPDDPDFIKRVYELRDRAIQNDPERAAILRRAEDLSLYSTYNNKPYGLLGNIAEGIGSLSRQHRILVPLFVPFTKIVSNVTNESLNYVPVIGAYRAFKAFKEAGTSKTKGLAKTTEEMETVKAIEQGNVYAVQATIGLAAMMFVGAMSFLLKDEDDDGQDDGFTVTGTGPKDPAAFRQAREAGFSPYSFSFGGNQIKVSYLATPLAMPLAILGTWTDQSRYPRGRDKNAWEKLTSAALTVGQVPFNQSFLQGLSGLFQMLDGRYEGQDRAALEKFVNSTLGSVVPNFARQVEDVFNPVRPTQTSWWGKWIFNKVPVVRNVTGRPTLNVLGEEVNAPMGLERYLFLQRFINTSEADPLFKLLSSKNAFIPDAKRGVMIGNYQLTDDQYYRYRELRGKYIARVVRTPSFFNTAKKMTPEQLDDYLTEVASKASSTAKKQIVPELIRAGVKLY